MLVKRAEHSHPMSSLTHRKCSSQHAPRRNHCKSNRHRRNLYIVRGFNPFLNNNAGQLSQSFPHRLSTKMCKHRNLRVGSSLPRSFAWKTHASGKAEKFYSRFAPENLPKPKRKPKTSEPTIMAFNGFHRC